MVQETSLLAYDAVLEHLGRRQFMVLNAIRILEPTTDSEIAAYLCWPINCVTPRRGELEKKGMIVCCGVTEGRRMMVWRTRT